MRLFHIPRWRWNLYAFENLNYFLKDPFLLNQVKLIHPQSSFLIFWKVQIVVVIPNLGSSFGNNNEGRTCLFISIYRFWIYYICGSLSHHQSILCSLQDHGYSPYSKNTRAIWVLENITIGGQLITILVLYRTTPFTSYNSLISTSFLVTSLSSLRLWIVKCLKTSYI